ncbi:MAG: radical SAM protein [bacterium]
MIVTKSNFLRKYFNLNPDCFLIKGKKRGAIYDLVNGDVYSIDEDSVDILTQCEKRISMGEVIRLISGVESQEILEYFSKLESLGLGEITDKGQNIQKQILSSLGIKKNLDFIWLELTEKCNLRCLHCYGQEDFKQKDRDDKRSLILYDDWIRIIKEARQQGCRKLQFIGGEPMLFKGNIFELIKLAKVLEYEIIEVFTNATLLRKEDINLLAKYGAQVAISVYSYRSEIHDKITRQKGSFNKTVNNVKALRAENVKVRLALTVMKQNEGDITETVDFLKDLNDSEDWGSIDVVRCVGGGLNKEILPKKMIPVQRNANFGRISKEQFFRRKSGHSCWQGKLCVTFAGDVLPCIMGRNEKIGNIKKDSLTGILNSDKLIKLWGLSKDKIEVCRDCEYRYVCFDCRPQAKGETGNLYAKPKECLYNPYIGEWQSA